MRTIRVRPPSTALVVSCLALFAALGGTTYAATANTSSHMLWQNAALQHGWGIGCCDPGYPGYAKDSNGVVHLRGALRNPSPSTSDAFVLPKGMRPNHDLYINIYTNGGTYGYLVISPTGTLYAYGQYAYLYASLNGISFVAGE